MQPRARAGGGEWKFSKPGWRTNRMPRNAGSARLCALQPKDLLLHVFSRLRHVFRLTQIAPIILISPKCEDASTLPG